MQDDEISLAILVVSNMRALNPGRGVNHGEAVAKLLGERAVDVTLGVVLD
jgi:hypothetical protein